MDKDNKFKFDVVIGNPPFDDGVNKNNKQATPIYNLFVEQVEAMGTPITSIIMPSRWFAGGMGLKDFRELMMNDDHIMKIVDYPNSKDVFQNTSIGGGVCYFIRNVDYKGNCEFINVIHGKQNGMKRSLNEFPVLVRYNEAVSIIRKVSVDQSEISSIMSPLDPFGLSTNFRGNSQKIRDTDLKLHSSTNVTYVSRDKIKKGEEYIDKYKVLISKASSEHAGESDKDGKYKVIPGSMKVIMPGEICTHTYFVAGEFNTETQAKNLLSYLKTKFVRFLMLQASSGINLSKKVFLFVPKQNFDVAWNDEKLYEKYRLDSEEISFIESMMKDMK